MDPFAFLAGSQKPEAQKPEARDLPTLQPSRNVSGFPVRDRDVNRGVPVAHRTIANVFGSAREKIAEVCSPIRGARGRECPSCRASVARATSDHLAKCQAVGISLLATDVEVEACAFR